MGFILLAQAKMEEAVIHFQRAIRLDSTLGEPFLGLGIAHMRQGSLREAVAAVFTATTLEPRLLLYQSYLGKAFFELREFEQAFGALDTAARLDPRDPTHHLYSGIFENDLNRPGQAVEHFQESIRLNDNRAVYRSRFVLDEDRATRNVQLAGAYKRLGLAEWANQTAVRSTLSDPTNSSAHLFLANTFLHLPGRTAAAGSELLLARLLLSVNSNSFNAFNDYTTLYEKPRLNWTAGGSYGSFDTVGAQLVSSGGTGKMAFGSSLLFDRSAGFRPINDHSKDYTGFFIFKYGFTPHSDLILTYSHQQRRVGDRAAALITNESSLTDPFPEDPDFIEEPYRFPVPEGTVPFRATSDGRDPNRQSYNLVQRLEIGYQRQLHPGSELVFFLSSQTRSQVSDTIVRRNDRRDVPVGNILNFLRNSSRIPNLDLQATHLFKAWRLRFKYGLDIFAGRSRSRDSVQLFDNCGNGFFFDCEPGFLNRTGTLPSRARRCATARSFFRAMWKSARD